MSVFRFAEGFYDALGYDVSGNIEEFQRAFDEGIVAIRLENLSGAFTPVIKKKVKTIEGYKCDTTASIDGESYSIQSQESRKRNSKSRNRSARQEYRDRQILFNKVKNYWVNGILKGSLYSRAQIELEMEERFDAVDLAWDTPEEPKRLLPLGTKLINKFDEMGAGRTLVILGDAGSGKTTLLVELACDLINRAQRNINHPIPVVLNLSSWTGETVADWLVQELNTNYQVTEALSRYWIKEQQLLLLLDGLDEVKAEWQTLCVYALNQFSHDYGRTEMVVCSRISDYSALTCCLRFQLAIFIKPLSSKQINDYLNQAGSKLTGVKTALKTDIVMQALATTPLMLSVMAIAYEGMSVAELPKMPLAERRQHLFNKYIERMFKHRRYHQFYPKNQVKSYLSWLAKQMFLHSQSTFFIDKLNPDWLENETHKNLYTIGYWSFFGISFGLVGLICGLDWINVDLFQNLSIFIILTIIGLSVTLVIGLISGIFLRFDFNPTRWYLVKKEQKIIMLLTLSFFLIVFYILYLRSVLAIFFILFFILIFLLILAVEFGLIGQQIKTETFPNQGIWQSAKIAMFFLTGVLGLGLLAGLMVGSVFGGMISGLFFGLLFGMFGGGSVCIEHLTLRLILYFSRVIPWNYARFLDYTTERIFLLKIGGGYKFIHRLLQEHFAKMEFERMFEKS